MTISLLVLGDSLLFLGATLLVPASSSLRVASSEQHGRKNGMLVVVVCTQARIQAARKARGRVVGKRLALASIKVRKDLLEGFL